MISKKIFIHTFKQKSEDLYQDISFQIRKHRKLIPKYIVSMGQTHSNNISKVENLTKNTKLENTDALITSDKNALLVIKTADCIPLVITNIKGGFVIAAHVGWKSLYNNFEKTLIKSTLEYEKNSNNLKVYIGPSIKKCCYIFRDKPIQAIKKSWKPFINESKHNWSIDLQGYLKNSLKSKGVINKNIFISPDCTYHNNKYFSYKKDTDLGKKVSGTMLTIVQLI